MKKTILHISKYYYPHFGGIEAIAQSLAEGLEDYENVVVCFDSNSGGESYETINGIEIYRVHVNISLMSQDIALGYYRMLKRLMDKYEPQYVHLHCPNPYLYPLVQKAIHHDTKLVLHWHSDILSKGLAYKIVKPFENNILKRADLIVVTSPNYIHPTSPVYQFQDKVRVVQNGVAVCHFNRREDDQQHIEAIKTKYGNQKIVLFIGRHIAYKGIDTLIEAEKYIENDCKIIITGSGPLTRQLKSLSKSPRVIFTGRLERDELRYLLYAADVFAFPSNTKAEAFGIALAEAMYCRCVPVVFHLEGSGVNWVSVKDKTGMEVPLGDVRAFAKSIDQLLSQPQLMEQYAERSHQRVVDLFTDKIAVDNMNELYHQL